MTGKEFLENFDPQIVEVGYENYFYTPKDVIVRLDAFKKQLSKTYQNDITKCTCHPEDTIWYNENNQMQCNECGKEF